MAVHNQVRVVGYVKGEVTVLGEGVPGGERVLVSLRTMPREIDIYQEEKFQDIMVFYDGKDESLMARLKHLHAYDIVDIKGVHQCKVPCLQYLCVPDPHDETERPLYGV